MSRNLAAAGKAKKGREAFEKPDPAPEPSPPPATKTPTGNGTAPKKEKRAPKPKAPPTEVRAGLEAARAEAEAEAAKAMAELGAKPKPKPKSIDKADRQRLRRATRRHVAVELSITQGVKLDLLTEHYGSQRAAIGALIDAADLPEATV